jgi:hypothetical protein
VAVLNPDHLFQQANKLITGQTGPPRQVDIRRSISVAYYATFHATITAAVDQFVGITNRDRSEYGLVYRSVSHAWFRDLCKEVQKPVLSSKFKPHAPANGFSRDIVVFSEAIVQLQQKRHSADYDVMIRMNKSDAILAIKTAEAALRHFGNASKTQRQAFLILLLFPPRS